MPPADLQEYYQKRNFAITPEPEGKESALSTNRLSFCIQKHDASRLHYDFRLELGGVLKSWAVTKGPSYDPQTKRLAMPTEDHPLSYGDFEGTIPQGQYGGGTVMLWDQGQWIPKGNPYEGLEQGKLSFTLKGEKMQGDWALIRMKPSGKKTEKDRESWLLIKEKDDMALTEPEAEQFLEDKNKSVKSGRSLKEIEDRKPPYPGTIASDLERKAHGQIDKLQQKYSNVQLATLVDSPPEGNSWLHEIKLDGYRVLCFIVAGTARVLTRNGHDWSDKFPSLIKALQQLPVETAVMDGEAVVLDDKGISSFNALQNALSSPEAAKDIRCYLFDLLQLNGDDYAKTPQIERKEALKQILDQSPEDILLYSEHLQGQGSQLFAKACDTGLEGIISKKAQAPYSARRSQSWLKVKCTRRQEFVICGYNLAKDRNDAVGALHLGYYKDKRLVYAGKVGTGFTADMSVILFTKLLPMRRKTSPFDDEPAGRFPKATWVEPDLICEVQFASWTESGKVRHASFQGLREDKDPVDITRDRPAHSPKPSAEKHTKTKREKKQQDKIRLQSNKAQDTFYDVVISHPERLIFPGSHITKSELAAYYSRVGDMLMPLIKRHPLTVIRCPGGLSKNCFYQRSKGKGMPDHIFRFDVNYKNKDHDYLYIEDTRGLVELVQMNSVEFHPWGSVIDDIHKPDRMIFDLDPGKAVPFEAVKLAAEDIRKRLQKRGLKSLLLTTGGKGLHILIPLAPKSPWPVVKSYAQNFAKELEKSASDAYIARMTKAKRYGKIFIDYLRNDFSATAIMPLSVRNRPGAPVAMPLAWNELDSLKRAGQFHINDVSDRLPVIRNWIKDFTKLEQLIE